MRELLTQSWRKPKARPVDDGVGADPGALGRAGCLAVWRRGRRPAGRDRDHDLHRLGHDHIELFDQRVKPGFRHAGLSVGANVDATSTISVTCTNSTPYSVGLDNGHELRRPAARRMRDTGAGTTFVNFGLYTDAARTNGWTTTTSAGSCTGGASTCALGTGSGAAQIDHGLRPHPASGDAGPGDLQRHRSRRR